MDWQAVLIGAIPSVVSIIVLLIQVARDRQKDVAIAGRTRAETAQQLSESDLTRVEATQKIILMYEKIIERLERRIKNLEEDKKKGSV